MGNKRKVFEKRFKGVDIYLHDKGQFFPGMEMQRLGQSSKLFLKKDFEWMGHFVMSQKTVLSKESSPCEDDPGYSYLNCIMSSISKMAGCHLDWFSPLLEENTKSCENVEEILRCRDFKQVLKI